MTESTLDGSPIRGDVPIECEREVQDGVTSVWEVLRGFRTETFSEGPLRSRENSGREGTSRTPGILGCRNL